MKLLLFTSLKFNSSFNARPVKVRCQTVVCNSVSRKILEKPTTLFYFVLFYHIHAIFLAHLILLELITVLIFGKEHRAFILCELE